MRNILTIDKKKHNESKKAKINKNKPKKHIK